MDEFFNKYPFNHGEIEYYFVSKFDSNYYGFVIENEDKFFCVGSNRERQLSVKKCDEFNNYFELSELSGCNVCQIYQGNYCHFARTSDGKVYSWGGNMWGQLGIGAPSGSAQCFGPTKITFFDNDVVVCDISCGNLHNVALTSEGKVFGWGDYSCGQIKQGNDSDKIFNTPVEIKLSDNVKFKYIHCYCDTTIIIDVDDNVYFCGEDNWGLSLKIINSSSCINKLDLKAHKVVLNEFVYLLMNNVVSKYKDGNLENLDIENMQDIFYDSKSESLLYRRDEIVYIHDDESNESISTNHKTFDEYYMQKYKICINLVKYEFHPKPVEQKTVDPFKQVCDYLYRMEFETNKIDNFAGIKYFYVCTYKHTQQYSMLVVDYQDQVFGYRHTNDTDQYESSEIIKLNNLCNLKVLNFHEGLYCMIARSEEGRVFSWSSNEFVELTGRNCDLHNNEIPIEVPINKIVVDVKCGALHVLALTEDGEVYGWGRNNFGQIDGTAMKSNIDCFKRIFLPQRIQLNEVIMINCYKHTSLAINENKDVFIWGEKLIKPKSKDLIETPRKIYSNIDKVLVINDILCLCKQDDSITIRFKYSEKNEKPISIKDISMENIYENRIKDCLLYETETKIHEISCKLKTRETDNNSLLEYFSREKRSLFTWKINIVQFNKDWKMTKHYNKKVLVSELEFAPKIQIDKVIAPDLELSQAIQLTSLVRGYFIIVNNLEKTDAEYESEEKPPGWKPRAPIGPEDLPPANGMRLETDRFKDLFTQLNFEVLEWKIMHIDLLKTKIEKLKKDKRLLRHEVIALMIVTHGQDESILGYYACNNVNKLHFKRKFGTSTPEFEKYALSMINCDRASFKDIVDLFTADNFPQMKDKPKLLFFTACRVKSDITNQKIGKQLN